ncbi:DUF7344 domain-containing protein [Halobacteriaceae archaeon SHR40]|uniref:DUF7344 domain-containing protein n=1 Tax=Halovenus amylolytica TaxID=2500550 RepID=UPI000FE4070F
MTEHQPLTIEDTMKAPETPPSDKSLLAHSLKKFTGLFERGHTRQTSDSESSKLDLESSEVFDLLSLERRQAIIKVLHDAEKTPVSVSELSKKVAAIEYNCAPSELDSAQEKRIYIAAYQVHIPYLAEASVVTYDSERQLVDRGENFDRVHHILQILLDALGDH